MIYQPEEFIEFDNYYNKSSYRRVVFKLYKGICQGCNTPIEDTATYQVGHIIPKSEAAYFKEKFIYLDVHNLLNLRLLCTTCKQKSSNHLLYGHLLQEVFNYSAKVITTRLSKIDRKKKQEEDASLIIDIDLTDIYKNARSYGDFTVISLTKIKNSAIKFFAYNDVKCPDDK